MLDLLSVNNTIKELMEKSPSQVVPLTEKYKDIKNSVEIIQNEL